MLQGVFSAVATCYLMRRESHAIPPDRREAEVERGKQVAQTAGERRSRRAAAWRAVALLVLASLAIMVQACREEEQERPLVYDKGTYLGQVDQKLDQEQVDALRQRATEQQI